MKFYTFIDFISEEKENHEIFDDLEQKIKISRYIVFTDGVMYPTSGIRMIEIDDRGPKLIYYDGDYYYHDQIIGFYKRQHYVVKNKY